MIVEGIQKVRPGMAVAGNPLVAAFASGDPYRGEIAAVDQALGRLLDAWDARPEPDVVAVTGALRADSPTELYAVTV